MSIVDETLNTGQQSITNYDVSKIFVWKNKYKTGLFENGTYDPIEMIPGRLLGRVSATQKIVPHASDAADGSQFPVGVLAQYALVDEGEERELMFCVDGHVVENKVILAEGDTLDTVIDGRSIRDRIGADTVGINLIASTERTGFDNQ